MTRKKSAVCMSQVAHKLIGTRCSYQQRGSRNNDTLTRHGPVLAGLERYARAREKGDNFGRIYPALSPVLDEITNRNRLVFFGEIHSVPPVVALELALQERLCAAVRASSSPQQQCATESAPRKDVDDPSSATTAPPAEAADPKDSNVDPAARLHVILEHFSFDMQPLLDGYQRGEIDVDGLIDRYDGMGTENHDLRPYRSLLEHARVNSDSVSLHAGFLPRRFARMLVRDGEGPALEAAAGWLPSDVEATTLEGSSPFHYDLFESMITGRSIFGGGDGQRGNKGGSNAIQHAEEASTVSTQPPSDRFRGIFRAQILKDVAMAHRIKQLIRSSANEHDRFLVIAGRGHLLHYQGVPERVLDCADVDDSINIYSKGNLVQHTCLIFAHPSDAMLDVDESDHEVFVRGVQKLFGLPGSNPGDFLFVYDEVEGNASEGEEEKEERNGTTAAAAKVETAIAYDKVGETAHLEGNIRRARAIMVSHMRYTEEEFAAAGADAVNYQGVGNPHLHAGIQPGERVLDIGSGLGVDTFVASKHIGESGSVVGIDISKREVRHAQKRAEERGLDQSVVRFIMADMEDMPFPDDSFDVVISNGAFCLAPDKEKAFAEVFRVLKPGGRISVCTTALKKSDLEAGVKWPLCMQMFAPQDELRPMCERIGFVDVLVDDSNSLMTIELPAELVTLNPQRNRVHVGSREFEHLENFDMDKICACVCVFGRKPL